jgi:hypothetical protein
MKTVLLDVVYEIAYRCECLQVLTRHVNSSVLLLLINIIVIKLHVHVIVHVIVFTLWLSFHSVCSRLLLVHTSSIQAFGNYVQYMKPQHTS